ncbi:MAG: TolC family protein [Leptolyngbyaceae cyanobacterium CSU_1_4]|nr:TolC family protein [Leptolyngbyaceae cyanobacterium CSU_1_4]
MQPYNSLIALGVSAVFAVSLVKIDPAQAESAPNLPVRTEAQESPTPSEVRQQRLAERRSVQAAPAVPETSSPAPARPRAQAQPAPPSPAAAPSESAPLPKPGQPSTGQETGQEANPAPAPAAPVPSAPTPAPTPAPPLVVPTEPLAPAPSAAPSETAPLPSTGQETPTLPSSPAAPSNRRNANRAPENLNPSPNPLNFPTTPEEVTVVESQPITLQQAIELAIRNSPTLQQTRLELTQSRDALREVRAANFPTLDATSSLTGSAQEGLEADNAQGVATGTSSRDITTSLNLQTGLQADYNIFTSGRRSSAIRAAEGTVRFRELAVEVETKQLVLDVSTSYYDLQEADQQVEIFQAALSEALQSLRDAQALERAGVGTRFDVLQAEVDAANARQDLTQQLSSQEVARRTLAQRLSLAQATDITAADEVAAAGSWALSLEQSIVTAFKNRAELEQQLVQRDIGEQRRRNALGQLGPQIGATATYGIANLLSSSNESSEFSTEGKGFFNNASVALNASINLFDGGAARAQARQQEANIAIAESQFVNARDQIRFQVEQAYSILQASSENIQTTTLAVQSAEEALRLARLRFQAGVGTQTDVIQQQTALTRSRVNNLGAILDYNRSLAQLQRFVSNLPDGNLSETP